jgi:hypothetical protein
MFTLASFALSIPLLAINLPEMLNMATFLASLKLLLESHYLNKNTSLCSNPIVLFPFPPELLDLL